MLVLGGNDRRGVAVAACLLFSTFTVAACSDVDPDRDLGAMAGDGEGAGGKSDDPFSEDWEGLDPSGWGTCPYTPPDVPWSEEPEVCAVEGDPPPEMELPDDPRCDNCDTSYKQTIRCLRVQNAWISQCMDGIWGYWTSLTGQLDNCIADFDQEYPECINAGVSAKKVAQEVHEAYGPQGEIIGGALGIAGNFVGDAFKCAVAPGFAAYVLAETGTIVVTGNGFGDASVSDETLEQLADSCFDTAANAGILATAIAAPVVVGGVVIADISKGSYDCYDACFNHPDPDGCTQTCYQQGAEALALVGFLYAGGTVCKALPSEMLAPKAFGVRLQPFARGLDFRYRTQCRATEGESQPECLDNFLDTLRYRIQDPTYKGNTVNDYGLSKPEYFPEQLELLNGELGTRFGGRLRIERGDLDAKSVQSLFDALPEGTHGLAVGHGHSCEPNHGFYIGRGKGGVSTQGAMGWQWPKYEVFVYEGPTPQGGSSGGGG